MPCLGCAGGWAAHGPVPAVQAATETSHQHLLRAAAASTIPAWLTAGSTNYNTWLQPRPFWCTTRALLLNAQTAHSQENYPKPKRTGIQGEFIKNPQVPCADRLTQNYSAVTSVNVSSFLKRITLNQIKNILISAELCRGEWTTYLLL